MGSKDLINDKTNILNNSIGNKGSSPACPVALIIVPTRELAEQIYLESTKLTLNTHLNTVRVYGGTEKFQQIKDLNRGADILIATPGRLIDFLVSEIISLKSVKYFIIDEADRIMDMGFEPQLNEIVFGHELVNKENRQNLFFSATFTKEIKNMAFKFMNEYYFVNKDQNNENVANSDVKQEIIEVLENDKFGLLVEKLGRISENDSVIGK